jgi:DNA-binding Xre family transcriptional regulator
MGSRTVSHLPELIAQKGIQREAEEHAKGDKRYKFTLTEIARETGLTPSVVHAWVKDHITTFSGDVLATWCDYLNCEPGDILKRQKD